MIILKFRDTGKLGWRIEIIFGKKKLHRVGNRCMSLHYFKSRTKSIAKGTIIIRDLMSNRDKVHSKQLGKSMRINFICFNFGVSNSFNIFSVSKDQRNVD